MIKSLVSLWGEVYCLRGKLFSVNKLEGPTMNYLFIFFFFLIIEGTWKTGREEQKIQRVKG